MSFIEEVKEMTDQQWLNLLSSRNHQFCKKAWYAFCEYYDELPFCNIKNIDFSAKDCLEAYIFSKEEFYNQFFVFLLTHPQSPKVQTLLALLEQEEKKQLAIPVLAAAANLSDWPEFQSQALALLRKKLAQTEYHDIFIKILERINYKNYQIFLPLLEQEIRRTQLHQRTLGKIIKRLQKAVKTDEFSGWEYRLLETIGLYQDNIACEPALRELNTLLNSLCHRHPENYETYRNLLSELVRKFHKKGLSKPVNLMISCSQSPFNTGDFKIADIFGIIDEIKSDLYPVNEDGAFWTDPLCKTLFDWIDCRCLKDEQTAALSVKFLDWFITQRLNKENIVSHPKYPCLIHQILEKVIFGTLFKLKEVKNEPDWKNIDRYPDYTDCPAVVISAAQTLLKLDGLTSDTFQKPYCLLWMCYRLHRWKYSELSQFVAEEFKKYCRKINDRASAQLLTSSALFYPSVAEFFCCNLNLIDMCIVEKDGQTPSSAVRVFLDLIARTVWQLETETLQNVVGPEVCKLWGTFAAKFSSSEKEIIGDIVCHCGIEYNEAFQIPREEWEETLISAQCRYQEALRFSMLLH